MTGARCSPHVAEVKAELLAARARRDALAGRSRSPPGGAHRSTSHTGIATPSRATPRRKPGPPCVPLRAHRAVVDVDVDTGLVKVCRSRPRRMSGSDHPSRSWPDRRMGSRRPRAPVMEEVLLRDGLVRNASFTDYLLPTRSTCRPRHGAHRASAPDAPYGAKGVGSRRRYRAHPRSWPRSAPRRVGSSTACRCPRRHRFRRSLPVGLAHHAGDDPRRAVGVRHRGRCPRLPDDARRIFDGIGATYEKAERCSRRQEHAGSRLVHSVRAEPDDRVLDVATAPGLVARALANATAARSVGLDRSADMLSRAAAATDTFPLVRARAESLPFADDSFDHVTSRTSCVTFADPARPLRELARVVDWGRVVALDFECHRIRLASSAVAHLHVDRIASIAA